MHDVMYRVSGREELRMRRITRKKSEIERRHKINLTRFTGFSGCQVGAVEERIDRCVGSVCQVVVPDVCSIHACDIIDMRWN